jgi:hypothetical protein
MQCFVFIAVEGVHQRKEVENLVMDVSTKRNSMQRKHRIM